MSPERVKRTKETGSKSHKVDHCFETVKKFYREKFFFFLQPHTEVYLPNIKNQKANVFATKIPTLTKINIFCNILQPKTPIFVFNLFLIREKRTKEKSLAFCSFVGHNIFTHPTNIWSFLFCLFFGQTDKKIDSKRFNILTRTFLKGKRIRGFKIGRIHQSSACCLMKPKRRFWLRRGPQEEFFVFNKREGMCL